MKVTSRVSECRSTTAPCLCSSRSRGRRALGVGIHGDRGPQELDEHTVKILVQLKVHDTVANNFEYCHVVLPFFHRCVALVSGPLRIALALRRSVPFWGSPHRCGPVQGRDCWGGTQPHRWHGHGGIQPSGARVEHWYVRIAVQAAFVFPCAPVRQSVCADAQTVWLIGERSGSPPWRLARLTWCVGGGGIAQEPSLLAAAARSRCQAWCASSRRWVKQTGLPPARGPRTRLWRSWRRQRLRERRRQQRAPWDPWACPARHCWSPATALRVPTQRPTMSSPAPRVRCQRHRRPRRTESPRWRRWRRTRGRGPGTSTTATGRCPRLNRVQRRRW